MGVDPLVWFCRPAAHGVWAEETDSAFGAYSPCAIDSVVGNVSYLVLLALCLYRIWLMKNNPKLQRFSLRSNFCNYGLAILATCCAAEPLFRLLMGISIFNLHKETGLAPYEVCNFSSIFMLAGAYLFFFLHCKYSSRICLCTSIMNVESGSLCLFRLKNFIILMITHIIV